MVVFAVTRDDGDNVGNQRPGDDYQTIQYGRSIRRRALEPLRRWR